MMFGNPEFIAIEIGELIADYGGNGPYVQFRFIINGVGMGDWDDRIPLRACIERATDFQSSKAQRLYESEDSSKVFFERTYDAFYKYDYGSQQMLSPNLRDRHHLSEIGMSALSDKVGIAAAESSDGRIRIVVKNLQSDDFLLDTSFDSRYLDRACDAFILWAKERWM